MSRRGRLVIAAAVTASVLLHCIPVAVLWLATGRNLPSWSSPDPYLYVILSAVHSGSDGLFTNPWYGSPALAGRVPYFRFGLALRLFHVLSAMCGSEGTAFIAWNVLIHLALSLAVLWLLLSLTRDPYAVTLTFLSFTLIEATALLDLAQIRTGRVVWIYGLANMRAFFPQFSIPLVVISLGAILRWVREGRFRWLGIIGLMQFLGLLSFPYSAPVIVGTFCVATVASLAFGLVKFRSLMQASYLVGACVALDGLWLLSTRPPFPATANDPVPRFDPSLFHMGRSFVFPLLLGLGTLALPQLDKSLRVALGSIGVTVALGQLGNAFASPAMNVGGHIEYFFGMAMSPALVAVILATFAVFDPRVWRILASVACILVLSVALLQVRATIDAYKPYNRANGQLATLLRALGSDAGDLVVVPVHGFRVTKLPRYWESSWVPLVSRATVLYSHSGALGQAPESREQSGRLATYLFLMGESPHSIDAILAGPPDSPEQHFLAGWERESLIHELSTRAAVLAEIRRELVPRLSELLAVQRSPFMNASRRVIIADYRDIPVFSDDRVARLVTVETTIDFGDWRVRVGHSKRPLSQARPGDGFLLPAARTSQETANTTAARSARSPATL